MDIYIENKELNTYYNMKKVIRLTESDLHRIVKESVNRILNESDGGGINGRNARAYFNYDKYDA